MDGRTGAAKWDARTQPGWSISEDPVLTPDIGGVRIPVRNEG